MQKFLHTFLNALAARNIHIRLHIFVYFRAKKYPKIYFYFKREPLWLSEFQMVLT